MNKKKPPVIITQWWAPKNFGLALARQVASYRKRYEKGERVAALYALDACLNNDYLPDPDNAWMLNELWVAVTALHDGADPNEAFGFVRPKGKHVEHDRKKRRDTFPIMLRIYDLHHRERKPIDEGTFAIVGREFNYSYKTVQRIFYANPVLRAWLSYGIREIEPEPKPKLRPKSKSGHKT